MSLLIGFSDVESLKLLGKRDKRFDAKILQRKAIKILTALEAVYYSTGALTQKVTYNNQPNVFLTRSRNYRKIVFFAF